MITGLCVCGESYFVRKGNLFNTNPLVNGYVAACLHKKKTQTPPPKKRAFQTPNENIIYRNFLLFKIHFCSNNSPVHSPFLSINLFISL